MPTKISINCIVSILLVISISCFAFGALTKPAGNLAGTVLPEEATSDSAGRQTVSSMHFSVSIPDIIVSSRDNNAAANAKEIHEFSRRYNNKQSIVCVLLMLFLNTTALTSLLFKYYSMAKTAMADTPILALSLGGNSPPVIRA